MRLIKGPPLRFVAPSLRAQRRTANATTAPFDARRLMARPLLLSGQDRARAPIGAIADGGWLSPQPRRPLDTRIPLQLRTNEIGSSSSQKRVVLPHWY